MKFFRIIFFIALFSKIDVNANNVFEKDFQSNDYQSLIACKSDELFKIKKFISFENREVYQERTIENFDKKIVILYFWSTIYQSLDEELKDINNLAIYLKEQKINDIVILPIYTTYDDRLTLLDHQSQDFKNEIRDAFNLIKNKYDEYDIKNLTMNADVDQYFHSLRGEGDSFDDCDYENLKNLQGHRGILPAIFIIDKDGKQVGKYLQSLTSTSNDSKWNSKEMHNYLRSLRGNNS